MRLATMLKWGAAGWLGWRLFGPELSPRFSGVQQKPLRATGRTVMVGQREFFIRELGPPEAPPVVLLHGWAYDSEATWFKVAPDLATSHRVVMIDHRNHGKSDRIRGRYTIDEAADETAGVLVSLGLGPVPLVGYSMGGMVAQALARRHPLLVDRLVLTATAAFPIERNRIPIRVLFWLGRALARVSRVEGSRIALEFFRRLGAIEPHHERWLWDELMERDPTLYYEGGHAVWHFDSRPWVGRLDVPALVVIPTGDLLVPPTAQYELASLLKDAEIVEVIGVGHEAALTRGPEIAKAIAAFLQ